ncbi:hypothetical protein ACP4OV_026586 [Aristida adscensionis]
MGRETPTSAAAAAAASFPASMEGERVRFFRPYHDAVVYSLERLDEKTLVKLKTAKPFPSLSEGESILLEGHGLRCNGSLGSVMEVSQEDVVLGVEALDCQVRPCNACGNSELPMSIPAFSDSLVGKPMRFSRLGCQNVAEGIVREIQKRDASLSIVRLGALAAPPSFCMGDFLVLESLDGQHRWEADVRYCGDPKFFQDYNEPETLESAICVHVRDQHVPANRGCKYLPPEPTEPVIPMLILVKPIKNENVAPSQTRGNKAISHEAQYRGEKKIKIGINGYGSLGRTMVKVALESQDLELVAINDGLDQMTCMCRDDQWLGRNFKMKNSNTLLYGEKEVTIFRIKEPDIVPWGETGAEYTVTAYVDQSRADYYKARSSKYSRYADSSSSANIFAHRLSPLAEILQDRFGTVRGVTTSCRAPLLFIEPQNNNAAMAVGEVLPHWNGLNSGLIFQVPTADSWPIDVTIELDSFNEYRLIGRNTKPSFGFASLLAWCVEMIRQMPQVSYCEMRYK